MKLLHALQAKRDRRDRSPDVAAASNETVDGSEPFPSPDKDNDKDQLPVSRAFDGTPRGGGMNISFSINPLRQINYIQLVTFWS